MSLTGLNQSISLSWFLLKETSWEKTVPCFLPLLDATSIPCFVATSLKKKKLKQFLFIKKIFLLLLLFIYFGLYWVFIAMQAFFQLQQAGATL